MAQEAAPFVYDPSKLKLEAVDLLRQLIATPSFSREEEATAALLKQWLDARGADCFSVLNNVVALSPSFDPELPTILLNSHHDTVKPNKAYTRNPFEPAVEGDILYGLGSNDAGGPLVALMASFIYFLHHPLPGFNIIFVGSAEEEISGINGIEYLLKDELFIRKLGGRSIDFAIVGEPTQMHLAIAEKGLMVLDAFATGKPGHAAREEGINALYIALDDINRLRKHRFEKISDLLGPVRLSVTVIETDNKAHNIVPSSCRFTIDVRVNECYTLEEIQDEIAAITQSEVKPRSLRLRSTGIAIDHPIVQAGLREGRRTYGSPTTSDKALMPFPALKMGPGDSARSHSADEFIHISEIHEGIDLYIRMLKNIIE